MQGNGAVSAASAVGGDQMEDIRRKVLTGGGHEDCNL